MFPRHCRCSVLAVPEYCVAYQFMSVPTLSIRAVLSDGIYDRERARAPLCMSSSVELFISSELSIWNSDELELWA